jgi:hypothetical protein
MKVSLARTIASEWVMMEASRDDWFLGAYFSGSTIGMSGNEELPLSSDIDIMVITSHQEPLHKLGKFYYRGVLLEVTYLPWNQLQSAEDVLSSYHLANSFRTDSIIADSTGYLHSLQSQVSRYFADELWVRRRCQNVQQKIMNGLQAVDISAPLHDRITSWLFPTGITTHIILVAALRNPTVRLRYLAARSVLEQYGHSDLYLSLLELLGCSQFTPNRIEYHLNELARAFDTAAAIARTWFPFSADITTIARPVAIDGSRELIRTGNHREAVFWIAATFARCLKILAADGSPELHHSFKCKFDELLSDIGICSNAELMNRCNQVMEFLPRLWETTEAIISANPEITGR